MKKFIVYALLFVALVALCGWNVEPVECVISKAVFCILFMGAARLAKLWDLVSDED